MKAPSMWNTLFWRVRQRHYYPGEGQLLALF